MKNVQNKPRKNFDKRSFSGAKPAPRAEKQRETAPRPALYGFHAVREAFLNEAREIQILYMCEAARQSFDATLAESRKKGLNRPAPTLIEKKQMDSFFPAGAVHQGLALACAPLPEINVQDLIIRGAQKNGPQVLLILDQVTDPHNVGAILRSACAFGAGGMILQRKHAPEMTGALAKSACGALEHVPVAFETNLSRTIEELQENGYFIYGLDERGAHDIGELDVPPKSALVLGAEGPGLRHLVKEHCDALLRLPMSGAMPSINVSNAAAVALYAFTVGKQ